MSARILIVDDVPTNVKLLKIKLEAEYFEVLTASDGPAALEAAVEQSPDVILLDVMMPEMDGFEVCRRLKADPRTTHIPVVMVTALSDMENRVRGLEVGADDFLSKPLNDIALFARVRSLARLKVMMDELRVRQATNGHSDLGEQAGAADEEDLSDAMVLVVEPEGAQAGQLVSALTETGYRVEQVAGSDAALARAGSGDHDLIIVPLHLGDQDGLRLSSQLRSQEGSRHTPILMVLDSQDLPRLAKGLELGVNDYLIEPFDGNELRARTRTQVRRRRYHERLRDVLEQSVTMAYTDALTGIYNRRYLSAHLDRKIMEIGSQHKPVSVLLFDIDHFKPINDKIGHSAGDEVLKQLARRVTACLRDSDMVARYGGEEFVVVLPSTKAEEAQGVAERLRARIADEPFAVPGSASPIRVTVSIGLATTADPGEEAAQLLARADEALYRAKDAGRDRVVSADLDPPLRERATAGA